MRYKSLCLLLPSLFGLAACDTGRSTDVNQSKIQQSYELTYNEDSAQLKASAAFHNVSSPGAGLKLTDGSTIDFDGSPMPYTTPPNMTGYHLEKPVMQPLLTTMEFRYVNNDGEVFVTAARVPPPTVIKIPQDGDRIRSDGELAVLMEGEPLKSPDELTLCLSYEPADPSTADPAIRECLHSTGGLSLVFSREQLARFPGNQELTLQIKRESHPEHPNARIQLQETFFSRPVRVILHEEFRTGALPFRSARPWTGFQKEPGIPA